MPTRNHLRKSTYEEGITYQLRCVEKLQMLLLPEQRGATGHSLARAGVSLGRRLATVTYTCYTLQTYCPLLVWFGHCLDMLLLQLQQQQLQLQLQQQQSSSSSSCPALPCSNLHRPALPTPTRSTPASPALTFPLGLYRCLVLRTPRTRNLRLRAVLLQKPCAQPSR